MAVVQDGAATAAGAGKPLCAAVVSVSAVCTHEHPPRPQPPARCLGPHRCVQPTVDLHAARLPTAVCHRRPPLRSAAAHRRKVLGHLDLGTTLGYAAVYSEDVVTHHRAFIARRRGLRPAEEYRDLSPEEWDQFLSHFELRKVALGTCTRDFGTPCLHEHSCIRCPLLRPDPAQTQRLVEIRDNLHDRITEARREGWLGEVAGLETSLAAAEQKLQAARQLGTRPTAITNLGMPGTAARAER